MLWAKSKLKGTEHFSNVWMRGSMPHMEHLIHLNFKILLILIPDGQKYRVSGSGHVIPKAGDKDQPQNYATSADPPAQGYKCTLSMWLPR